MVISNPWANPLLGGPRKLSSGGVFDTLDKVLASWVNVEQTKAVIDLTKAQSRQAAERGTVDYQDGIKAGQTDAGNTGTGAGFQVTQNMVAGGVLGLVGLGLIAWMVR